MIDLRARMQVAELLEDCVAHVQQPTVNALPQELRANALVPTSALESSHGDVAGIVAIAVMAMVVVLNPFGEESRRAVFAGDCGITFECG